MFFIELERPLSGKADIIITVITDDLRAPRPINTGQIQDGALY